MLFSLRWAQISIGRPYGLVGDEKSYGRQLDGDFFADVKNSDLFLQALKEDAEEKQVDAAHLKSAVLTPRTA